MEPVMKKQRMDFEMKSLRLIDFPDEIILKILRTVTIKDLFRCMAVSKKVRAIAQAQFPSAIGWRKKKYKL